MRKALYGIVIVVGFLRIAGWLLQSGTVKGLGAITAASPLPIVFTEVKGVETFASDVYVVYENSNNSTLRVRITPSVYSKLNGPYNRRNVFGAAIAYGPVLDEDLWRSVLGYGLCSGVLQRELGLPDDMRSTRFVLHTRTAGSDDEWTLDPGPCR
ncbi:MAG: hypothetical protein IPJ76_10105 [Flavobacteriales bacterium]|nr:MAG: hypothetical protein IPJ76_10105 [Flavobacteriales bacterium]